MLMSPGDWSLTSGDLAMTKDGDIKVGDIAYNGYLGLSKRGGIMHRIFATYLRQRTRCLLGAKASTRK